MKWRLCTNKFHVYFEKSPFDGNVYILLVFLNLLLATTNTTSSAGSNKTDLLTGAGISSDSGGLTNVLMVTTTVRMLNGIHGNTTHLRPRVPLCLVLVVSTASLQDGLVNTATTCNDAHHGSVMRLDHLLGARGKLHAGFLENEETQS